MKNSYELYIREPYYTQIEQGIKTTEGRIAKNWLRTMKPDSNLIFKQGKSGRLLKTNVDSLHIYNDFPDMILNEELESLLPGCDEPKEAIQIYENLPRFKEQAAKFGVIAIRFTVEI